MIRLLRYYSKYQTAKGNWGGMPTWARGLLFLVALPGVALVLLSVLAFFVSLFALLLLVVPVYRLLTWLTGATPEPEEEEAPLGNVDFVEPAEQVAPSEAVAGQMIPGSFVETTVTETAVELTPTAPARRRQIEVRIVE